MSNETVAISRYGEVKFLGAFTIYAVLLLGATQLPLDLLHTMKLVTAAVINWCWTILGIPALRDGVFISFDGFLMEITLECTALHYATIYSAGVLAFHYRSRRQRVLGVIAGLVMIFAVNILRIGVLGVVGRHWRPAFELIHVYLWQGSFALLVLLTWILWASGWRSIKVEGMRPVLLAVSAATVSFLVLRALLIPYAYVLATIANTFYAITALAGAPSISTFSAESAVAYQLSSGVIYNSIYVDVISAVLFFALLGLRVLSMARGLLVRRGFLGAGLLCVQHVLYVIFYGFLLNSDLPTDNFSMVLWFTRGMSMVFPLLIWLLVALRYPEGEGQAKVSKDLLKTDEPSG